MTPFLLYIARAGLYMSLFYAFYLLVMRRTTFFGLNRAILLSGSYLCLLLPLIRIRRATITAAAAQLAPTAEVASGPQTPLAAGAPGWEEILLAVYAAGALVTLGLYLSSAWKMGRLIRSGESRPAEGCRLVVMDKNVPSFSWGRTVVISRQDMSENPAILVHEKMHVRCRHSLDLLLLLPLQVLFWWNPLLWITREELRLLHEYEADEGVLNYGIDATQYQLLLVRKAVGEQRFSLASGFQHANLKNRITMMHKPISPSPVRWSYLAVIPLLLAVMFACNPKKSSKTAAEAVPYELVEVKPAFNDGDIAAFAVWAYSQIQYPEQAKAEGAAGRVLVQFTVGSDGKVGDVKVLRGVHESLDAEVVRAVSSSPKWTPGKQGRKAVPVEIVVPFIFKLN